MTGNCDRKRKTTQKLDSSIMHHVDKIADLLVNGGVSSDRRTVNNRHLEVGLIAYCSKKKPQLTETMMQSRYECSKQHTEWTFDD